MLKYEKEDIITSVKFSLIYFFIIFPGLFCHFHLNDKVFLIIGEIGIIGLVVHWLGFFYYFKKVKKC